MVTEKAMLGESGPDKCIRACLDLNLRPRERGTSTLPLC